MAGSDVESSKETIKNNVSTNFEEEVTVYEVTDDFAGQVPYSIIPRQPITETLIND